MTHVSIQGTGHGPIPPLLEQYIRLRDAHPEYLLLFQVGEFYETFGEDAERFARALGLTLTHKSSKDFSTPMAGIPMRAADVHIERLLKLGFRVAVADQVQDPSAAQGLVERAVTQLVTPGTVQDDSILRGEENWLAAISQEDGYGLALLDVSTGEFRCCQLQSRGALFDELARYRPSEVLASPELLANNSFATELNARFRAMQSSLSFDVADCKAALVGQFTTIPKGADTPALLRACGAAIAYASRVNPTDKNNSSALASVRRLLRYDPGAHMRLDETAIRALEIFEPLFATASEHATLFGALNLTRSAPGRRRLKAWLRAPLLDAALIGERLEAVAILFRDATTRQAIRANLHKAHDLERLAARVALGRANARDLNALARTLALVPELQNFIAPFDSRLLRDIAARLDPIPEAKTSVIAALEENAPLRLTDGGLIRDGYDAELDEYRAKSLTGRTWIAALEEQERKRTGIAALKVGFNNVFGYYLEITNQHAHKVPTDYRPVQTLKDRQRFTRPDLREREREVLHFEERAQKREYSVFLELRAGLAAFTERLQLLAGALSELDVIAAFAEVAAERNYVRPEIIGDANAAIEILQARHPVVELMAEQLTQENKTSNQLHSDFIANNIHLPAAQRLSIITGPNMSGKSTYLRQTGLLALMVQVGCFVPAKSARTKIFDRIYTRVGASDDLAGGASTFMVEMRELANILHGASRNSLVILDEIGRGTSTFDGLAIAQAACEFLIATGATTLFATHYFELTNLESKFPGVSNLHVAAEEEVGTGGLRFYHQVMPGPASKSYGVQVARLAGLPPETLQRAEALLKALENNSQDTANQIAKELKSLDVSRLTPIEALQLLLELQKKLGENQ